MLLFHRKKDEAVPPGTIRQLEVTRYKKEVVKEAVARANARTGAAQDKCVQLILTEFCEQDKAEGRTVQRLDQVRSDVLRGIRQAVNADKLQLCMEQWNIGSTQYAKIAQVLQEAVNIACDSNKAGKILPTLEALQAKRSQLDTAAGELGLHHPALNPGCKAKLHPVCEKVAQATLSKGDELYMVARVDANQGNLYGNITNLTDHVMSEQNPHPQLIRYQDPTSVYQLDWFMIKPDYLTRKNDDTEAPEVLGPADCYICSPPSAEPPLHILLDTDGKTPCTASAPGHCLLSGI